MATRPGGDDFVRSFRADPDNQLANGHFDCGLGDWVLVSTNPAEIVHGSDDADGSADSGSAAVENLTASTDFALGQCVAISATADYALGARVRMATAAAGVGVRLTCTFYDATDCAGTQVGGPSTSTTFLGDTAATWVDLDGLLIPPVGSDSALCSVDFVTVGGESFEAGVDRVRLVIGDSIFSDGFESGNTSAWSLTLP